MSGMLVQTPKKKFPQMVGETDTYNNSASMPVAVPANAQKGDLLILAVSTFGRTASTPSGWNLLVRQARSTTSYGYIFWKLHSGSEPASVTVTLSGTGTSHQASMKAWRGVSQTAPIGNFTSRQVTADVKEVVFTTALSTTRPNSIVSYWTGVATTSAFEGLAWTNATPGTDNFLIGSNKYLLGSARNEFPVAGATPTNVMATRTGSGTVNNWWLIWFVIQPT